MPIYEFYCRDCHTIYSFLSKRVAVEALPACPGCRKQTLQRQVSRFAVIGGGAKTDDGDEPPMNLPIDESKMESAMASLAAEAEGMSEDDPRAAAHLMRKLSDMTGMQYNDMMEAALDRLEAGEDPDTIEAEMGEMLAGEEMPFVVPGKKSGPKAPPRHDEKLYDLE
jgi:putative FmdB family regulatory protein